MNNSIMSGLGLHACYWQSHIFK